MDTADFSDDARTRFVVAKKEAIRFIEKRSHDAIGLVFFGKYAISRCPITFDKKLLKKILEDLQLGFVDPDGTVLSRAIVAAVNRLRNSASKTKIMIVLTDGEPSEDDIDISVAIQAAQRYGIKLYTVGIGSDREQVVFHPLYGPIIRAGVNTELLSHIALSTGGQMFMAHNAIDMRLIYDTIDQLERTAHDVPLFKHQIDLYQLPLFFVFVLFLVELLLSTTIWFCL
jgi:Ca-activated chloride channel family protein